MIDSGFYRCFLGNWEIWACSFSEPEAVLFCVNELLFSDVFIDLVHEVADPEKCASLECLVVTVLGSWSKTAMQTWASHKGWVWKGVGGTSREIHALCKMHWVPTWCQALWWFWYQPDNNQGCDIHHNRETYWFLPESASISADIARTRCPWPEQSESQVARVLDFCCQWPHQNCRNQWPMPGTGKHVLAATPESVGAVWRGWRAATPPFHYSQDVQMSYKNVLEPYQSLKQVLAKDRWPHLPKRSKIGLCNCRLHSLQLRISASVPRISQSFWTHWSTLGAILGFQKCTRLVEWATRHNAIMSTADFVKLLDDYMENATAQSYPEVIPIDASEWKSVLSKVQGPLPKDAREKLQVLLPELILRLFLQATGGQTLENKKWVYTILYIFEIYVFLCLCLLHYYPLLNL